MWAALGEQSADLAEQRWWTHKLGNVLDALPSKHQAPASTLLRAMPYAATQAAWEKLREQFPTRYQALAPKAVERLHDDGERLVTFYQFPQEHWVHLRTSNPIESTFATVRLRTRVTKGPGSRAAGVAMAFKLIESAQTRWRAVNAPQLVALVRAGATFTNGKLVEPPDQSGGDQQAA